jgi:cytochrome P450
MEFDSLRYIVDNARDYGGFYGIYMGDTVTYVVTDPQLVHEILVARHSEFHKADLLRRSAGELLGNGLLTSEDDFWKRQRKLAQPAFHYGRIAAYATTMVQSTRALIDTWRDGETRDIAHDMMSLTLDIVTRTLFGVDVKEKADRIGQLMHVVLEAANDRLNAYNPVWERLFQTRHKREQVAMRELIDIVDGIIAEHRKQAEDTGDLLSMLMAARDDEGNPMSEKQLRDEVMTLCVAGHETTANALSWAFYLLSQNPSAYDKLRGEIAQLDGQPPTLQDMSKSPYSEMVMKEVMRLYPPAGGATRAPLHDIELGGYRLPKGSNIAISTYGMHHDPALFPDPEKFDPGRFSPEREATIPKYAYLPFGGGPRVCIGNTFAMMESRLALITILQRFKLALAPNQTVKAEQLFTIRPKGGLRMIAASTQ